MSKIMHDERAAKRRVEQFDKTWINECMALLGNSLPEGARVLDIGCGNGELADRLKVEKGLSVSCLDYAPSHLERVKEKGYETFCCHLDKDDEVAKIGAEFRESYDVVTALDVVEHLFTPDVLFKLAYDVLKPGGLLLVSTPNMAYISYRLYSMFQGNLPAGQGHHVAFYDSKRLAEQYFVCGFDVMALRHYGEGSFYLDRAAGLSSSWLRKRMVNLLFQLGGRLGPLSMRRSGLIAIGRKSDVQPLGLSGMARDMWVAEMDQSSRIESIQRMRAAIAKGQFDSHPDLRQFCKEDIDAIGGGC